MGYKKFVSLADVQGIYKSAKRRTRNLNKIDADLLCENPRWLLLVRLALGKTQREFSKLANIDRSSIAHYELGLKEKVGKNRFKAKLEDIDQLLARTDFSWTRIKKNYEKFWEKAKKGQDPEKLRILGRDAAKSRQQTEQERHITGLLKKLNKLYEREGTMTLMGLPFVFDFLIPSSNDPKSIIECKEIKSKTKRSFRIVCYKIAYEIGYKFQLLKKQYPNAKKILILNTPGIKMPQRVAKILENECDFILENPKNLTLLKVLKSI